MKIFEEKMEMPEKKSTMFDVKHRKYLRIKGKYLRKNRN